MLKETKIKLQTKRRLLWVAVIGWALLIFCFSAQPADSSNRLSGSVTAKLLQALPSVKALPPVQKMKTVEVVHNFIRKLAHFTIYGILGIWVYCLCGSYRVSFCKAFFIAFCACAAYAATDEFHQLFVPGRSCMLLDVVTDSAGSVAGILLMHTVHDKLCFLKEK